jgi:hypothetical protein
MGYIMHEKNIAAFHPQMHKVHNVKKSTKKNLVHLVPLCAFYFVFRLSLIKYLLIKNTINIIAIIRITDQMNKIEFG